MKILLLGKNGQVGWELQRSLAPLGELVALDRHPLEGLSGDLSELDALRATIRKVGPDIIVNAAAGCVTMPVTRQVFREVLTAACNAVEFASR
jgi:dTDP-4-dehydrorhamnose reductase